jgi:hypothetical protein
VGIGVLDDIPAAQYGSLAQGVGHTFFAQGADEIGEFRRQLVTGRTQQNLELGIHALAEATCRSQQTRIGMAHAHGKQHLALYFATRRNILIQDKSKAVRAPPPIATLMPQRELRVSHCFSVFFPYPAMRTLVRDIAISNILIAARGLMLC